MQGESEDDDYDPTDAVLVFAENGVIDLFLPCDETVENVPEHVYLSIAVAEYIKAKRQEILDWYERQRDRGLS
jgi:hypothetical protein